jgi:hypothetical protein
MGKERRIDLLGFSPKNFQLTKVTMSTWELPILVAIPVPNYSLRF